MSFIYENRQEIRENREFDIYCAINGCQSGKFKSKNYSNNGIFIVINKNNHVSQLKDIIDILIDKRNEKELRTGRVVRIEENGIALEFQ